MGREHLIGPNQDKDSACLAGCLFEDRRYMKMLVLQRSPNLDGSTAMLCDALERGAQGAGHSIERTNVSLLNIVPCGGCVACGYEGPCILHDDMDGRG